MAGKNVLVMNFGSTSTKLSLYRDGKEAEKLSLNHGREELNSFGNFLEQRQIRRAVVERFMQENKLTAEELDCVVARYGVFKAGETGFVVVDDAFADFIRYEENVTHILYTTPLVAYEMFGGKVPVIIADSEKHYQVDPVMYVSGVPEIPWVNMCHTENTVAASRKGAAKIGKPVEETKLVVAHLGGGISVSYIENGKIKLSLGDGETFCFTPERSGSLPLEKVLDKIISGEISAERMWSYCKTNGGMLAHLGTTDGKDIEDRAAAGDEQCALVYSAMSRRVAMTIGAAASLAMGELDAIVLTGGLARSDMLVDVVRAMVGNLAPIVILPGEFEMDFFADEGYSWLEKYGK